MGLHEVSSRDRYRGRTPEGLDLLLQPLPLRGEVADLLVVPLPGQALEPVRLRPRLLDDLGRLGPRVGDDLLPALPGGLRVRLDLLDPLLGLRLGVGEHLVGLPAHGLGLGLRLARRAARPSRAHRPGSCRPGDGGGDVLLRRPLGEEARPRACSTSPPGCASSGPGGPGGGACMPGSAVTQGHVRRRASRCTPLGAGPASSHRSREDLPESGGDAEKYQTASGCSTPEAHRERRATGGVPPGQQPAPQAATDLRRWVASPPAGPRLVQGFGQFLPGGDDPRVLVADHVEQLDQRSRTCSRSAPRWCGPKPSAARTRSTPRPGPAARRPPPAQVDVPGAASALATASGAAELDPAQQLDLAHAGRARACPARPPGSPRMRRSASSKSPRAVASSAARTRGSSGSTGLLGDPSSAGAPRR